MSKIFGEIRQLGFVVEDIEAAMHHWATVIGVGPWFYAPSVPVQNFQYRGKPSGMVLSVALANSGPLQIELVQQRNDEPSIYRDFVRAGKLGLQHVAYWTEDYDGVMARAAAAGLFPVMSGDVGAHGRYCYFDTELHPGSVVELSETVGPKGKMFRLIRDAAREWDGRDPVRPFPDLTACAD
jgi:hypothetical protein